MVQKPRLGPAVLHEVREVVYSLAENKTDISTIWFDMRIVLNEDGFVWRWFYIDMVLYRDGFVWSSSFMEMDLYGSEMVL